MNYTRDADAVRAALVLQKDKSLKVNRRCSIQVPVRWTDVNLATISNVNTIYGLFPVILETGQYLVFNVCASISTVPDATRIVTRDGVDYYEFIYNPGSKIIETLVAVKNDKIIFPALSEMFMKGKVPWYVTPDDLARMFSTAKKYAGSNVANIPAVIGFMASVISRVKSDPYTYVRHAAKTERDYEIDRVEYVPFSSVIYSVNGTINKLAGAYFNDGVISAIVNPQDRANKYERIIRA